MRLESERLVITEFDLSMAESVHKNSLDEDTRNFVPDEVFETVEDAKETLEYLMSVYESGDGPLVYPVLLKDETNIGYVQLVPIEEGYEVGYHIGKEYTNNVLAGHCLLVVLIVEWSWCRRGGIMMSSKIDVILKSIEESSKMISILPKQDERLLVINDKYSISKESTLGAIINNTGGIIVDGWIRIYGAGELDFAERNMLLPYDEIVIGEDILGGLFIILEGGNVAYFAPDTLGIEDMEISFGQFVQWCFQGDTDTFYMDYRWEHWQDDVKNLGLNYGMSFYPYLWAEAESLEKRHREPVPMKELIGVEMDFLQQIGN